MSPLPKIRVLRVPSSDFFRQATGASVWNFAGMAFTLANGVLTSRLLAPADRGMLALILTATALTYLVSSIGTNTAVRVFRGTELWASLATYFRISAKLLFLNVGIVSCAAYAFVAFGLIAPTWVLGLTVILGIVTFVSNQLLDVLNAEGLISRSAAVNNLGHVATMVLLLAFFVFLEHEQLGIVVVAYIVGFVVRVLHSVRVIRSAEIAIGALSPDKGRILLRQGARFWGINVAQTLTSRADQLLLASLASTYAVGIYAVAATPASVIQVVANSIGQVALREAANGLLAGKRLLRMAGIAFLASAGYSLVLWLAAPALIPFIFGRDYIDAVPIVRILVLAELARGPYLVLIRALAGLNKPLAASATSIIGLPTLVVSMLLLVPRYGVEGAGYAVVLTSVLLLLVATGSLFASLRTEPPLSR